LSERRRDPFNLFGNLTLAERRGPFAPPPAVDSLASARQRASEEDDRRQATLAERERIKTILTNPISARQPRLAVDYAFKTDDPAEKAIAMMEASDRDSTKSAADLIILAGRKARGELPCDVNAGPKTPVNATAESILAAARKARGED
jgi:hypothetical protein